MAAAELVVIILRSFSRPAGGAQNGPAGHGAATSCTARPLGRRPAAKGRVKSARARLPDRPRLPGAYMARWPSPHRGAPRLLGELDRAPSSPASARNEARRHDQHDFRDAMMLRLADQGAYRSAASVAVLDCVVLTR